MAFNKKTNMYEGFIYCITNKINNKQYIGQTRTTIKNRWTEHCQESKDKNTTMIICKSINKYGKNNFIIEEIEKITSDIEINLFKLLNIKELEYIKQYNTISPNGYNISIGGNNRMSIPMKSVDQYDLNRNFIANYKSMREANIMTNTDINSISLCCMNKQEIANGFLWCFKGEIPKTEFNYKVNETIRKINNVIKKYDLKGNLVKKYNNIDEITNDKNARIGIIGCCSGKVSSYKDFVYRYDTDEFDKYGLKKKYPSVIKIDQYNLDGILINSFNSILEAEKITGISSSKIKNCITGKQKSTTGFIWCESGGKINVDFRMSRPICQYDLDGNFIAKFNSMKEASELTNICESSIGMCVNGRFKVAGGFIWCKENENINLKNRKRGKSINQYDLNNNFIKNYENIIIASEESDIPYNGISKCCLGYLKTSGGYIWKYAKEDENNENPTNTIAI